MISRTCSGSVLLDSILKESEQNKVALKHEEWDPNAFNQFRMKIEKAMDVIDKNLDYQDPTRPSPITKKMVEEFQSNLNDMKELIGLLEV